MSRRVKELQKNGERVWAKTRDGAIVEGMIKTFPTSQGEVFISTFPSEVAPSVGYSQMTVEEFLRLQDVAKEENQEFERVKELQRSNSKVWVKRSNGSWSQGTIDDTKHPESIKIYLGGGKYKLATARELIQWQEMEHE